jgi:hypothetical protein
MAGITSTAVASPSVAKNPTFGTLFSLLKMAASSEQVGFAPHPDPLGRQSQIVMDTKDHENDWDKAQDYD